MKIDIDNLFEKLKVGRLSDYNEAFHCKLILKTMIEKGRYSAFCLEAMIDDSTFFRWVKKHDLFALCYGLGKIFAREAWEEEGERLKDEVIPLGSMNHAFQHWQMMGWSKYGIGKTNRIKLDLVAEDTPDKHYAQLLKQAAVGDFTAGEIKQLMEAINVGLNTHQVFQLQKEIDQLKSDLATMTANSNGNDTFTDKRAAEKD